MPPPDWSAHAHASLWLVAGVGDSSHESLPPDDEFLLIKISAETITTASLNFYALKIKWWMMVVVRKAT